jgi:glycosyltransferase involved in cell wall biosynthesis
LKHWKNDKPEPSSVDRSPGIKDLLQVSSTPIPKAIIAELIVLFIILTYGLVLLHQDKEAFMFWIREDGLVEWLTFVVLMVMSAFSFPMSFAFSRPGAEGRAKKVWLFLGFLFLFGAMEEISWGQRILGVESPEWFLKHNRQFETNVHNLVIHGVNLNKAVFGRFLGILVLIHMLGVPILYRLNRSFKNFINRWAIPIPQNYQILLFIIVNIVLQYHLGLTKKISEMRELSTCFFFFLVLIHPFNDQVFPIKGLSFLKRTIFMKEGKS